MTKPDEKPEQDSGPPPDHVSNLQPSPRIIHFAGWEIGNLLVDPAIPSLLPEGLHWIQSRTGAVIPLPRLSHAPWEKAPPTCTVGRAVIPPLAELPMKSVLKQYLDVYHSSRIRMIFPVVDSSLFLQTMEAAYSLHGQQTQRCCAAACIFAFMALVSSMDHVAIGCTAPRPPPISRMAYVENARALMPYMVQNSLNLDAIQTALLLAINGTLIGELQTAIHLTSIAARQIMAVGAHTCSEPHGNEAHHLRTLFWICYALDKDLSLRTGQPHCLRSDDCNLQLPTAYVEQLGSRMAYSPRSNHPEGPLFPVDLRLSMIKSRIFTALYSYSGLCKSDVEIIRSIRELDDELEQWRTSIPAPVRPQLSFAHQLDATAPKNMFLVLTHLDYYSCVNLIHLAGGRCQAWRSTTTPSGMMDGLRLSLTFSVEASRSLLLFLYDSESIVSAGSFWTLLFYPMSAILTIFCNIVENRHMNTAKRDIQLLEAAEHTTEKLFLRQSLRADKLVELQPVTRFISSLKEFAQQAVGAALNPET
ncbi:Zn(II)2Cys6 transcription factor [Aspergillus sclerotioniger CBS 115572]|uniref:Zn(II)2Cys6 transcription factor n=1 Tax=Aspergillus sclerotioniger CBS 115572 TaxID=1450535 RepID=A0A317X9U1_9EURO|nr:Zn(II)2Cys6 transcription factor [Aspergillus sclerotioniger CBS 115572]PWY94981.1 Zn(II)2Cys6 transcription factor [Aspergillus sclerotioniger CBS 115572]